ncbi:DUF6338 family protein [Amycolatopsis alkalitolerans]|uniref:Uncharacterized protein n=1 Tax=Amycolatopsis alkalitolerans TaxID=2547244 RepID=A0A5C4M3P9_9PSEU|nr:DUF6338 family protein [Amycolatopsis alkalitolerans]TNC26503.1 hypothetical protein FG385_12180 [Amycolatopsis alkalitolerans]
MPTTLVGLLVFVVLLVPGFAYTLRRERLTPGREVSAFRQTVRLAFVSVVADAVVLGLFVVVRVFAPSWTPDVQQFLRDPGRYGIDHLGAVAAWSAGLLVAATVLALLVARPRSPREHEDSTSGWTQLFTGHPGARIHVGCLLDDGSYVTGRLRGYSRTAEDGRDRDLTLTGPISYRAPRETTSAVLPDVGAAAISARRLTLLTVSYESGEVASVALRRSSSDHSPSS